jgi:4-amino-4-deoxy-L-arabinose transferase-like glycosyltransferase
MPAKYAIWRVMSVVVMAILNEDISSLCWKFNKSVQKVVLIMIITNHKRTESKPGSASILFKAIFYRYHVLLLLLLALVIRLPLIFAPLTYTDSWRQADTASIAHNFYHEGGRFDILYPQINWGGSGPGYVEAEFQLYTFIVALLYKVFGEYVALGRLVSLAFTMPTLGIFYLLVRRMFDRKIAAWALFFFAIIPLSIRYSVTFMPEATVMFFYVAALYTFHRWLEHEEWHFFWLAAFSTALAVLVKPTAIHIGVIFTLLLLTRYRFTFLKMKRIWVFATIAIVPSILWYIHAYNLYQTYGNTFGLLSGGDTKFGGLRDLLSIGFYLRVAVLENWWVLALGGVVPALIGFVILVRRKRDLWVPIFGVVTMVVYYMLVSRFAQEEWGIHYHIYMIPYAALLAGVGLGWLWDQVQTRKPGLRYVAYRLSVLASVMVMVGVTGAIYAGQLLQPNALDMQQCAVDVKNLIPAGKLIIISSTSASNDNGLPNNYQDPRIFFYSHRYGRSLPADQHMPELIDQYRQEGAEYFVIYDQQLYQDNPAMVAYLDANAQQIGRGIEAGCGIYEFNSPNS